MPIATFAPFALSYAGLSALCMAMDRHHQQARQRSGSALELRVLRIVGWLLLTLSLVACLFDWGAGVGPVMWLGMLSASAVLLVLLLPYVPRAVVPCAAVAGSIGLLVIALKVF